MSRRSTADRLVRMQRLPSELKLSDYEHTSSVLRTRQMTITAGRVSRAVEEEAASPRDRVTRLDAKTT